HASPDVFESKIQIGFVFFFVGLAIIALGGSLRAAHERAKAGSSELRRAFEAQQAERRSLPIAAASVADAVITTDPNGLVNFRDITERHRVEQAQRESED